MQEASADDGRKSLSAVTEEKISADIHCERFVCWCAVFRARTAISAN
jgi:hypothetical protein